MSPERGDAERAPFDEKDLIEILSKSMSAERAGQPKTCRLDK
jgi:hypothetical protein